jgi:hypothetical protein
VSLFPQAVQKSAFGSVCGAPQFAQLKVIVAIPRFWDVFTRFSFPAYDLRPTDEKQSHPTKEFQKSALFPVRRPFYNKIDCLRRL